MDTFPYFSIKTYVMGTHQNAKAMLKSSHNVCFYGELTKNVLQLSSNTHLICSTDKAYRLEQVPEGHEYPRPAPFHIV